MIKYSNMFQMMMRVWCGFDVVLIQFVHILVRTSVTEASNACVAAQHGVQDSVLLA
jgi:hypothetical protein